MKYFPTIEELATLWPFWLVALALGIAWLYSDRKDRKAHTDWQKRMIQRSINGAKFRPRSFRDSRN